MTTCRHCGRPIQLDNTDAEHVAMIAAMPPEVITAALAEAFGVDIPDIPPYALGDFWRHADGYTICPGKERYTPDATYAEPAPTQGT